MVHGFFRPIRNEDRSISVTTLDLDAPDSVDSLEAVTRVLSTLDAPAPKKGVETEFVERAGVIYVNRVVPDVAVNQFAEDEVVGAKPVERSLQGDVEPVVMLRAEKLGTLEALRYSEITEHEVPMKPNHVEVEIYTAGLNFRGTSLI